MPPKAVTSKCNPGGLGMVGSSFISHTVTPAHRKRGESHKRRQSAKARERVEEEKRERKREGWGNRSRGDGGRAG